MGRLAGSGGAAATLLLAASAASAQTQPDTLRFRLDSLQIPVTRAAIAPERAPVALTRVDRARIQDARQGISLDEALAGVPGLIVNNRYNFALGNRIVVRGLGARAAFGVRGLRVIVDGIPLTMPDGQTNLNNLDLGSAGAIHVLRGPASALFGNAAGGVIAVETEAAPGPFSSDARVVIGDQGAGSLTHMRRVQAKVGQVLNGVDYVASISRLDADGFRDYSRVEQNLFNSRVGFDLGTTTRLSLVLNAVDSPTAQSPGSLPLDSARARPAMAWPNNVRTGSGEATRQVQLGTRVLHLVERGRADVSAYVLRRSLDNPLPYAYIELGRDAGGLRALYEHASGPGRPALTVGLDLEAQRDDRREFENSGGAPTGDPRRDQQDRVSNIGPFAQVRFGAGSLGVTGGARYDVVAFETVDRRPSGGDASGSRTLHAPSLMLGATYATAGITAFANVASSFQTPTTTELLNAPPAPGQPCCPTGFNEELQPQRALSREAGVRGRLGGAAVELVGYHMSVRDALIAYQVPDVDGREFFRNAGRTRHRGVELSGSRRFTGAFGIDVAWTYTDVRFVDDGTAGNAFEGNRVPGIPPRQLFTALSWSPGRSTVVGELRHVAKQYANDANTASSPAYTLLDVRAHTHVDIGSVQVAPFLGINNLLGTAYFGSVTVNAFGGRYYEPAPGRNVHIGASMRTGGWRR